MRFIIAFVWLCACGAGGNLPAAWAQQNSAGAGKDAITVGTNIQVSAQNSKWHHDEVLIAMDPTNPKRMMACGITHVPETAQRTDIVYVTQDGGNSWKMTYLVDGLTTDPACAFGTDGTAYLATLDVHADGLDVFVSTDGAMTWTKKRHTSMHTGLTDRPYFAVDDTAGKYHGRVYVVDMTSVRSLDSDNFEHVFQGLGLVHTDDRGAAWSDTMRRAAGTHDTRLFFNGNCDVFSEGELACIFLQRGHDGLIDEMGSAPPGGWEAVRVATAPPGGELFSTAVSVSGLVDTKGSPQIAIDRTTQLFKDRAYAVWSQGTPREVMFSYSPDRGRTWSKPIRVNDDETDPGEPRGTHVLPQVAVNRQGVVGVMWYDHREDPRGSAYRPRFSASLDGGETFLASVAIASAPEVLNRDKHLAPWIVGGGDMDATSIDPPGTPLHSLEADVMLYFAVTGDTAGLQADASGAFWGLWVDNRTNYDQMWTAPVRVSGAPVKHGSRELANLEDISDKAYIHYTNFFADETYSQVSLTGVLVNRSDSDLYGPIKARLLRLQSDLGTMRVANAENHGDGVNAVWQFELADGALHPGETSKPIKFAFNIQNPKPPYENDGKMRPVPVHFELQLLAEPQRSH
jgi:hypothetical protein